MFVAYRFEHTVVKKIKYAKKKNLNDPEVMYVDRNYNKYVDDDSSEEDGAFRSTGCKWTPITNPKTKMFYEATSKCYHKMQWRPPQYLEVVCADPVSNPNPDNIMSLLRKVSDKVNTIYFFGDSTMQQQVLAMDCMWYAAKIYGTFKLSKWITARDRDDFFTNHQKLFNITFRNNDVVVSNLGLHYQKNFSSIGKLKLGEHVSFFAQSVRNLSKSLKMHISDGKPRESMRKRSNVPMFVWRQGTPQNYPTPNGWWPYYFSTCKYNCGCTKLTQQMREGRGDIIPFSPRSEENLMECTQPAENLHEIATKIIEKNGIQVTKVYDALAAAPVNLHDGRGTPVDCTHFGIDALIYMNMAVMHDINALLG